MRKLRTGGATALGLAAVAFGGGLAATAAHAAAQPGPEKFSAVSDSAGGVADKVTGTYTSGRMSVEIALAPRDQGGLDRELTALYTPGNSQYHRFLGKGQFGRLYAPAPATSRAVASYLRGRGLAVTATGSPFLIRASGSSSQVSEAFRTVLSKYADAHGTSYFANSAPISVPGPLRSGVLGVVGLTDTVRLHPLTSRPAAADAKRALLARQYPYGQHGCETGYPTKKRLFGEVSSGSAVPVGYGGGPGCSGLTPSQINSLYGAPKAAGATEGTSQSAALFELSGYKASDPATWAAHFYGRSYRTRITNVKVDGGAKDDSGDIEATSDIDQEIAVAPHAHLYVYAAPNDSTGQGSLDEYAAIADADSAGTVSTSWGACEPDAGESYARSENTVFKQMAAQGQSVFAAAGDNGALDCIKGDGRTTAAVDDPGAQPWVTSVGGTSFGTFNPGTRARPAYPPSGTETVWNPDNLCSRQGSRAGNDHLGGPYWCGAGAWQTGAGGGGSSKFWGAPSWQKGPGVISRYAKRGTSSCALAATASTPCRQVPDVSADADEYTPYATYCTGGAGTVSSQCPARGNGGGWLGIGGTSLAAPLWAALITDRDGWKHRRAGDIGPLVYRWLRTRPNAYFHDIAAPRKPGRAGVYAAASNGIFPTARGYDEATGAGTPRFAAVIKH